MEVSSFSEIQEEFLARVSQAVYCSMATVDRQNRPRSRILHPVWEGLTGWVISWPATHKTKHLQHNPYVSLAYICHDIYHPVYVDCTAEWVEDRQEQQRVWAYFQTVPPPLGFDPQPHYGSIDHPHFGLLKLTPWRIELFNLSQSADTGQSEITTKVWRPDQVP
jgi:general stress protein 26